LILFLAVHAQMRSNTIRAVLATYGLGELSDYLYGVYARGEVNINNPDAIIFSIREQDAYKKRFAANAARAKKGLAELDPASYLQLENQLPSTPAIERFTVRFLRSDRRFHFAT
jgi:hypothetical protein